ncbi:hypothetical protein [Baekduia sp. Peel2402]|uniref:hypothetical protein n=1 Tax=Baekduia sp. Peel2402 TaxID=3458296 RepID=UPI00403ECBFE
MPAYDDYTYPLARAFGFLGGIAVAISTMIAWYDHEVVFDTRPIPFVFEVPVDLWSYDALAAALLLAGGLVAMVLLVIPDTVSPRWPSAVAGLIGLGVTAYALYRCFDTPDLGIRTSTAVQARTFVDGGPLLAVVGGVVITLGALVVLVGARRATTVRRERTRPVTGPPPSGAAPA